MSEKSLIRNFTNGNLRKQLLWFAAPLMLSNLLQVVYNMVDMLIVGRYIGSAGLSAVANGGDILHLATMLCMGFSSAGQILISQKIGRGDKEGIQKMVGTLFVFLSVMSVIATLLGLLGMDWILAVINVPEEAYAQAKDYGIVCCLGMFFIFGYNLISAILRGMGNSKQPLIFIAIAAVTNLVLDLLFVAVFRWSVWSAALATVIGQGLSYLLSILYLYKKRGVLGFHFSLSIICIDRKALSELVRLGVPLALQFGAIMISKLFVVSYINSYGLVISAINGIGSKLASCATVVTQALSSAGTSMIGQNFGARKPERIRSIVYTNLFIGLAFTTILSLIIGFFPEQIFSLFDKNPEVIEKARMYVPIAVLSFTGFALRGGMMSLVSGTGHSALAFATGLIDGIVGRIALAILLGVTLGMGIMGFWLGDVFASQIPFIVGGIYFWSGNWKKRMDAQTETLQEAMQQ